LEFSGFIAWLIWLALHLVYLIGFKTKITTLLSWTVTFLSTQRGQLTITDQQAFARTRLEQLAELAAEGPRLSGNYPGRRLTDQPVSLPRAQRSATGQCQHGRSWFGSGRRSRKSLSRVAQFVDRGARRRDAVIGQ
jgi:hypothetical protein